MLDATKSARSHMSRRVFALAAVAAIFLLVPRLERRLAGYPVPRGLATVVAVSGACGLVTAPILWVQFGAVPILSVVANAAAAPVVAPILGLGLAAASIGGALPEAGVERGNHSPQSRIAGKFQQLGLLERKVRIAQPFQFRENLGVVFPEPALHALAA